MSQRQFGVRTGQVGILLRMSKGKVVNKALLVVNGNILHGSSSLDPFIYLAAHAQLLRRLFLQVLSLTVQLVDFFLIFLNNSIFMPLNGGMI